MISCNYKDSYFIYYDSRAQHGEGCEEAAHHGEEEEREITGEDEGVLHRY